MYHQPTKPKENHTSRPEDPFILLRSPLHHPDSFPADPQRIRHTVQSLLRALQNLLLLPQIPEHGASTLEVLVQSGVGGGHERLFAEGVSFAGVVIGRGAEAELGGCVWVALGGGEKGRRGREGLLGVGVFGGGRMVGTPPEQFGAGLSRLLFWCVCVKLGRLIGGSVG